MALVPSGLSPTYAKNPCNAVCNVNASSEFEKLFISICLANGRHQIIIMGKMTEWKYT